MSFSRYLYRLARRVRDVEVVTSGNPAKMGRRARNKVLGRALARMGFWRRLW